MWINSHIVLPCRMHKLRSMVIRRDEHLKRSIRIVINFNEQTALTSFSLKINNMVIATLNDASDDNAVKNLVAHAHHLRVHNRHNINYSKL